MYEVLHYLSYEVWVWAHRIYWGALISSMLLTFVGWVIGKLQDT